MSYEYSFYISHNYEEAIDSLLNYNNNINKFEKNLLRGNPIINPNNFNFSGRFQIIIDDILFHCLHINQNSDSLIVFLNGARANDKKEHYSRFSYYKYCQFNILCIDDPMLTIYSNLRLGWYYGTCKDSFCQSIASLIRIYKEKQSIKNVFFFGSSGGGYASILCSYFFQDGLGIAINPQLILKNYNYYPYFQKITGIDVNYDIMNRHDLTKIVFNSTSKYVLIFNLRDKAHINYHLYPLLKDYNITVKYGITIFKNLLIWIYDADGFPDAHSSVETQSIFRDIIRIAYLFLNDKLSDGVFFDSSLNINRIWSKNYYDQRSRVLDIIKYKDIMVFPREKMITTKLYRRIENICISGSHAKFNFYSLPILNKNCLHSIVIDGVTCSTASGFTYGLANRKNHKDYIFYDVELTSPNKYFLNFITSDNIDQLYFVIYSGFRGIANDNDFIINYIYIYTQQI